MTILVALALQAAALLASPGPRHGLRLMTAKRWALTVTAPAVAGAVCITVISVILAGILLGSRLSRRLGGLLPVPAYYVAAGFLVPPLAGRGPGGTTLAWDGPLRITLSFLPFAVILGVIPATARRPAWRTPAGGRES